MKITEIEFSQQIIIAIINIEIARTSNPRLDKTLSINDAQLCNIVLIMDTFRYFFSTNYP